MTTQYRAPEQQDPHLYAARRSTPWGVIMAVGAAVIVACTLALVYLFGHLASPATGVGTPTSGSNQHAPVNPAVPTHPAVNPAVPTHPAG
jgi:hypothetical protein